VSSKKIYISRYIDFVASEMALNIASQALLEVV
jgi:hypothetical protein